MSVSQASLFAIEHGPEGFRYAPELLSREDETALVARMKEVPFRAFDIPVRYTANRGRSPMAAA